MLVLSAIYVKQTKWSEEHRKHLNIRVWIFVVKVALWIRTCGRCIIHRLRVRNSLTPVGFEPLRWKLDQKVPIKGAMTNPLVHRPLWFSFFHFAVVPTLTRYGCWAPSSVEWTHTNFLWQIRKTHKNTFWSQKSISSKMYVFGHRGSSQAVLKFP